MVGAKKPIAKKPIAPPPSSLRLVIYGQGTTEHRSATLLRVSDRLREELAEVAQGQLYLVIEYALRQLIDTLKAQPNGALMAIGAHEIIAGPSRKAVPMRAPRPRKPKAEAAA
jgi:hypothetical protein